MQQGQVGDRVHARDLGREALVLVLEGDVAAARLVEVLHDVEVRDEIGTVGDLVAYRERGAQRVARDHPEHARQRVVGDRLGVDRVLLQVTGARLEAVQAGLGIGTARRRAALRSVEPAGQVHDHGRLHAHHRQ